MKLIISTNLKSGSASKDIDRAKFYVVDVSSTKKKDHIVKGPFNTNKTAEAAKEPDDGPRISQVVMKGQEILDEGIIWGTSTSSNISLSRKRSHKSPRSSFMSKLMTLLVGDTGNDVANAFVKPDPEKFQELMGAVVTKMTESIKRSPPKVEK